MSRPPQQKLTLDPARWMYIPLASSPKASVAKAFLTKMSEQKTNLPVILKKKENEPKEQAKIGSLRKEGPLLLPIGKQVKKEQAQRTGSIHFPSAKITDSQITKKTSIGKVQMPKSMSAGPKIVEEAKNLGLHCGFEKPVSSHPVEKKGASETKAKVAFEKAKLPCAKEQQASLEEKQKEKVEFAKAGRTKTMQDDTPIRAKTNKISGRISEPFRSTMETKSHSAPGSKERNRDNSVSTQREIILETIAFPLEKLSFHRAVLPNTQLAVPGSLATSNKNMGSVKENMQQASQEEQEQRQIQTPKLIVTPAQREALATLKKRSFTKELESVTQEVVKHRNSPEGKQKASRPEAKRESFPQAR